MDKQDKQKGYVWWSVLPDSNVLGGRSRAKNAIRDEHGRFMPTDVEKFEQWKLDPEHGQVGGRVRSETADRDRRGRFA